MRCGLIAYIRNKALPQSGFTLMEIVVAIFIFAIVIGLVTGSFQGVFSNADHINATGDLLEAGNTCLRRITTDLHSIHVMLYPRYKSPDMDADLDLYRIVGYEVDATDSDKPKLRFASAAHLAFGGDQRRGIAQIIYYLQESDADTYILRRSDSLYPYPEFEPNTVDPILCEKVRTLDIKYYSVKGEERTEWDSESEECDFSTPRRIAITLTLGDSDNQLTLSTEVLLPLFRFKEDTP